MAKHKAEISMAIILVGLLSGCAAKRRPVAAPQVQLPQVGARWSRASIPFRAAYVTAVGNVFWACGADETIASSADGGKTWNVVYQNRGGGTLLNITFLNDKIGHAAGTGGRLLSTTDGGLTWNSHDAGAKVWAFSFADPSSGIAVIGGRRSLPQSNRDGPRLMTGPVKLTHDGGDHWEDIPALASEELRSFPIVVAIAALDSTHYLMIREHPEVEDAYVVTDDGGKSWKVIHQRDDATNRELASYVFAHGREYWAFGMELVHRGTGGGYGVPLTLYSKDGETWTHGVNGGEHEYGGCNAQGCYMWDGTIEVLYGERAQYWALPQDGSMSTLRWAIAGGRACTLGPELECGPATITQELQPRPEKTAPYTFTLEQKWEE